MHDTIPMEKPGSHLIAENPYQTLENCENTLVMLASLEFEGPLSPLAETALSQLTQHVGEAVAYVSGQLRQREHDLSSENEALKAERSDRDKLRMLLAEAELEHEEKNRAAAVRRRVQAEQDKLFDRGSLMDQYGEKQEEISDG